MMFGNLIESGSHSKDLKRRSSFFLGTLAFYAVLLTMAGVGSIYAYNARLAEPDFDVVMMMRFPPVQRSVEPEQRTEQRPAARSGGDRMRVAERTEISLQHPNLHNRAVARADTPEAPPRMPYVISDRNFTPADISTPHHNSQGNGHPEGIGDTGPRVVPSDDEDVPNVPRVRPSPPPQPPAERKKTTISLGVINGKALDKPQPVYPQIARAAHAQGIVTVAILVDESGKVISAQATGGHPMLRPSAVAAAYRARFTPTLLSQQPVKVSGFITYNFVLQ